MSRFTLLLLVTLFFGCESTQSERHDSNANSDSRENKGREKREVAAHVKVYNVALLVMDGTFNTELTAPMDIFQHTKYRKNIKPMNVFTVANTLDPITTFEGLRILPDYDYTSSYPDIDILVIPAAEHNMDTDLTDEALLTFINLVSPNADFVVSHCDGAFVLAKTGLLDDRGSTTFPGDVDAYKEMFPALDVREDVLFVHDGKFITSAGGAKSFEASLYLCELLYGKKVTDQLAKGMVIDWNLDSIKYVTIRNK